MRGPLRLVTISLGFALVAGCSRTADPRGCPAEDVQDPAAETHLHDQQIHDELLRALGTLADDDDSVTMAELRPQLEHDRCTLALPGATETEVAPGERFDRCRQATVVIGKRYQCDKCSNWHLATSSGVFISSSGACVTSHHVLDGKPDTTFGVMTIDGQIHPVRSVLAADRAADVVILQVGGDGERTAMPLRTEVGLGTPIWVMSHPASTFWYLSEGIVSRHFMRRDGQGGEVELLDITADFARGSSGAPVFDATGAVVGLVRSTRSIYYEESDGVQRNLQLVFKHCAPASAIRRLVE